MTLTFVDASHSKRAMGLRLAAKTSALKMRRFAEAISPQSIAEGYRVVWERISHRLRSDAKPNASPCRWRPGRILRRRLSTQTSFAIPGSREGHLSRVANE